MAIVLYGMTSPGSTLEELQRFRLFVAILSDLASEMKANTMEEPALRAPSDLLDYISDELTNRAPFKSRANADYVVAEASRLVADDPIIAADAVMRQGFADIANAAAVALNNNATVRAQLSPSILLPPVMNAIPLIDSGRYFNAIVARLTQQICDEPTGATSYEDLLWSVRTLITAFLEADFSIEHIAWFANYLVDEPKDINGELYFSLPADVPQRGFFDGLRFNRVAYDAARRAVMDAYTIRQRIAALGIWYDEAPREYTVIARVSGLRGSRGRDLSIGDVLFYEPLAGQPRFITCPWGEQHQLTDELLGEPGGINAAVAVSARDTGAARRKGIEWISDALDIVGAQLQHEMAIVVHRGRVEIVDKGGHLRAGHYGFDPALPTPNDVYALNLDHLYDEGFTHLTLLAARVAATANDRDRERLKNSLRALRRSLEAVRPEEQLLEAWIALEALLGDDAGFN